MAWRGISQRPYSLLPAFRGSVLENMVRTEKEWVRLVVPFLLDALGSEEVVQSHGYCTDRGEILGPKQEQRMPKRVAGGPLANQERE